MKKYTFILSILLLTGAIYWSFYALMPQKITKANAAVEQFSTERALQHINTISKKPHYISSKNHETVQKYLTDELKKLGLPVEIQEGYTVGDWGNLALAKNIITRIKGRKDGKALLLLSHYDSQPHSSYGASDAASGVATILEGIRAFLAKNDTPKNDIIILFSDGEELGLNGAELFVNKHPWAKDVGLVLNFESRGSGGPSIMLVETNGGNKNLIHHFKKANVSFPVANSLAYSIYKMLPNDTDLTVFREDGDIDGFNFAFIDDHFDYHTARDTYENLDRNTLEHQGKYLMPLLHYFVEADLSDVKSNKDSVYFNLPILKLVSYPFSWIFPMLILAVLLFITLLINGFRKERLQLKAILKGFLPFLITIIVCGVLGYFSFSALKAIYPQYNEMLHGFTYNGHDYIAAFVLLSIAVCFGVYHFFRKTATVNVYIAPLFFWLLICGAVAFVLKGASFFIIPAFSALASLWLLINQEKPNVFALIVINLPVILILSPFIQLFPVGLGLKMLIAATIFTVLIFGLMLAIFNFYNNKNVLAILSAIAAICFFVKAHVNSNFDENQQKPNSLVYVLDADKNKAQWATYDTYLDDWVSHQLKIDEKSTEMLAGYIPSSKYGTGFTYATKAPIKNIMPPTVEILHNTLINNERTLQICITPNRNVNRLDVFSENPIKINKCIVNEQQLKDEYLNAEKRKNKIFTHYLTHNDFTTMRLTVPKNENVNLVIYESSFDLLQHKSFAIQPRSKAMIPKPFVLNDAVIIKKTIHLD